MMCGCHQHVGLGWLQETAGGEGTRGKAAARWQRSVCCWHSNNAAVVVCAVRCTAGLTVLLALVVLCCE